jgi:hypothetical protein
MGFIDGVLWQSLMKRLVGMLGPIRRLSCGIAVDTAATTTFVIAVAVHMKNR